MNDDTYDTLFESVTFDPSSLFITVSNSSHQTVVIFLDSGKVSKDFLTIDGVQNELSDVTITFFQTINGSQLTIGREQRNVNR